MINKEFWKNRRVFITGHTGFKGSWLCIWLHKLGANVTGYALKPPTDPSLFELAKIKDIVKSIKGDVRDRKKLFTCLSEAKPDIVFHLAAQPLVRDSYKLPVETYETNVMGTVNILEAIRLHGKSVRAFVNVTTDKVYDNKERLRGYRENEPLGGYDPYSNSKACSEFVTAAYRNSYFNPADYNKHKTAVATARAGNVIGGGDWAIDRLVPDCMRAILAGKPIVIRNPHSIRPWQHVLEPLSGYLCLAEKMVGNGLKYSESWNFGPPDIDCQTVGYLVKSLCKKWGPKATYVYDKKRGPHEASFLKLDCEKSHTTLGWKPQWNIEQALNKTIEWIQRYKVQKNIVYLCNRQIEDYIK